MHTRARRVCTNRGGFTCVVAVRAEKGHNPFSMITRRAQAIGTSHHMSLARRLLSADVRACCSIATTPSSASPASRSNILTALACVSSTVIKAAAASCRCQVSVKLMEAAHCVSVCMHVRDGAAQNQHRSPPFSQQYIRSCATVPTTLCGWKDQST